MNQATPPSHSYDFVVIGSGPAGQQAAVEAARHGKRTAVIEKQQVIGGICLHTGTMPSKALREAVLNLTGWHYHTMCATDRFSLHDDDWLKHLKTHVNTVISRELGVLEGLFSRHRVALHYGQASFLDPHTLRVQRPDGVDILRADNILIATGSAPFRAAGFPFNGRTVIDADEIYHLQRLPAAMIVVGGGVIAMEYASIFSLLGIPVHVVNSGEEILHFLDCDIIAGLKAVLTQQGVIFHLGDEVHTVRETADGLHVTLRSGGEIACGLLLVATGRRGLLDGLELANAGLTAGERGQLKVDSAYRTAVPHIFAAGDIIGFPATASNAKVQGRAAARFMVDPAAATETVGPLPFGIYTIPEIAYVGPGERELQHAGVPYVSGTARFREVSKGEIIGDESGMIKLLFHRGTRKLLGVHIMGTAAAEIIHIGQTAVWAGADMEYFLRQVFNYPTLSEAYKIAVFDAESRL